jgi:hypothetical protein
MGIEEIKQYALNLMGQGPKETSIAEDEEELRELRARQLLLVASIAESLAGLNVGRLNARVDALERLMESHAFLVDGPLPRIEAIEKRIEALEKITATFTEPKWDLSPDGPIIALAKCIEALEASIHDIKETFPEKFS